MAKSKLEILVTAQTDKAAKELKKLDSATESLGGETGRLGGKFSILDGAMLAMGQAAVGLGASFMRSIPEMINLGAETEKAKLALQGYAGGAMEAEVYTDAVTKAAGGAVSEMAAMQNAAKLLSMGLASNVSEVAELTETAITLGAAMGKGPQQAFEEFTLMLANQSILRLDTFGISAGQVRTRIAELMAANEGLDRETAFMNATLEIAAVRMGELEGAGFSATNEMEAMNTIIANTKAEMGSMLWEGIMPLLRGLLEMRKANQTNAVQALQTAGTYEEYLQKMYGVKGGAIAAGTAMNFMTKEEWKLAQATQAAKDEFAEFTEEIIAMPTHKKVTFEFDYNAPTVQSIAGYQHGGSFIVGGQGVDQTPVSFMATRGEEVRITPPGSRGGSRDIHVHFSGPVYADPYQLERLVLPIVRKGIREEQARS